MNTPYKNTVRFILIFGSSVIFAPSHAMESASLIGITLCGGGCLAYQDIRQDRANQRIDELKKYLIKAAQAMEITNNSIQILDHRTQTLQQTFNAVTQACRMENKASSSSSFSNSSSSPYSGVPAPLPQVAVAPHDTEISGEQDLLHIRE